MKVFFATILFVLLAAVLTSASTPGNLRETGRGWPECAPTQKQYSGYFDINVTTSKHYFYWMIESVKPSTKLIIWLSGGPGCSSGLAALGENGPCQMDETSGNLVPNPYGWTNEATVLWLDQPAGVGYSYSDAGGADRDEKQVGHDNNAFVQKLLQQYPKLQSYELFIVGESYGGHYAPATASAIFNANKDGTNAIKVNLAGLGIGNGLVAPVIQYQYYERMATIGCEEDRPDHQPCVSKFAAEMMNASIPSCVKACKECDAGDQLACDFGRGTCNGQIEAYAETGLNPYDVTEKCKYPPLCYQFDKMTAFFNRADVKASFGVPSNKTWATCNYTVNGMFGGDWLHRFDLLIPPMLESGIRTLMYYGKKDFVCCWMGGHAVALALPWSGQAAFNSAPVKDWIVDGKSIGTVRSVAGSNSPIHMTFFRVADAGHMVPKDQPKSASLMINAFINNQPFVQN